MIIVLCSPSPATFPTYVRKAFVTKFLTDELDELNILQTTNDTEHTGVVFKLNFRDFEVRAVKLGVATKSDSSRPSSGQRVYRNRIIFRCLTLEIIIGKGKLGHH